MKQYHSPTIATVALDWIDCTHLSKSPGQRERGDTNPASAQWWAAWAWACEEADA